MSNAFGIGDLASMGLANVGLGPLNMGNMLDTAEFVRKAWSSFGVPSNFAPTIDLQELDRRISDLKAVEQWLTVNMNMLKGSIQALEIQRGTIATLQAFGSALTNPAMAMGAAAADAAAAGGAAAAASTPGGGSGAAGSGGTAGASAPPSSGAAATAERTGAQASAATSPSDQADASSTGQASPHEAAAGMTIDPALTPSAWWNMLQSQFNQVASAALSGVGLPSSALSGMTAPSTAAPAGGKKDAAAKGTSSRSSRASGSAGVKARDKARTGTQGTAPADDPRPAARSAGRKR